MSVDPAKFDVCARVIERLFMSLITASGELSTLIGNSDANGLLPILVDSFAEVQMRYNHREQQPPDL